MSCIVFLILGSWSDIKTREVSNKLWIVALPVVTVITVFKIYFSSGLLLLYLVSMFLSIVVSIAIFEVGFFGGADAKAMISLGVALPLFPGLFHPVFGYFHPFFPLTVLINSFLFSLLSIVYVIAKNTVWKLHSAQPIFEGFEGESFLKKLLLLLSGYKVEVTELRKGVHVIPLEDVDESEGGPSRKMRIFVGAEEDQDVVVDRLEKYASMGVVPNQVWVTPGLPMLVFISLSFIATLFLGDILFYAIFNAVRLASGL